MKDWLLLMHDDSVQPVDGWPDYLAMLRERGVLDGGSAIGNGVAVRRAGAPAGLSTSLGGYIRVRADDLDAVKALLAGNPVYEAGGTIEIRELPRD